MHPTAQPLYSVFSCSICSYEQTHGQVQQDTAEHDRGLFQCVTAVPAPNILGINAPTSNGKGKGHLITGHEGPEGE
jgi:hypothetical protein